MDKIQEKTISGSPPAVLLVIENHPDAITVLTGAEHRFVAFNTLAQKLIQGEGIELMGHTVAETWPEKAAPFVEFLDEIYRTGTSAHQNNVPCQIKDSRGWREAFFDISCIPVKSSDDLAMCIMVLVHETTEEIQVKKKLEEIVHLFSQENFELAETQPGHSTFASIQKNMNQENTPKNSAAAWLIVLDSEKHIEDAIGLMSQKLRTPLTAIRTSAQLISRLNTNSHKADKSPDDPTSGNGVPTESATANSVSELATDIVSSADRLTEIVNRLLDVLRETKPKPLMINLSADLIPT